jgi:hypothetical protein
LYIALFDQSKKLIQMFERLFHFSGQLRGMLITPYSASNRSLTFASHNIRHKNPCGRRRRRHNARRDKRGEHPPPLHISLQQFPSSFAATDRFTANANSCAVRAAAATKNSVPSGSVYLSRVIGGMWFNVSFAES